MSLAAHLPALRTRPARAPRTADLLAELHREIAALRRDVTGLRGDLDRAKTGDNR